MAFYFLQFRLPKQKALDSGFMKKELSVTEEDEMRYQQLCLERCSMSSAEKKKRIVKEVISPLLKENGFLGSAPDWYRTLSDGYLLAHLTSGMFNGPSTGNSFHIEFSVCDADVPKKELKKKWEDNLFAYISHVDLLPNRGMLSPYVQGEDYRIDGYRFYLPIDMPIDELITAIHRDFTEHILPVLCGISCRKEYEELRVRVREKDAQDGKETGMFRIMHLAVLSRAMQPEHTGIARLQQESGLPKDEILAHEDELQMICDHCGADIGEVRRVLEQALI
ncbi:MAG: hypothetical protein IJR00_05735 [Lachnospiraceae bacterium]|nr:hypothetical protein [Lachnospiraceae bacterium]